jgi:fibronectin-binding autotransporter adhesin
MSQIASSSRLSNSAVNIIGATTAISTNFGLDKIGVTGNSFDISSSSGNVTLGITGTGNVQLGNATSGTVSFPGTTTFAKLNSPAAGTNMSIGGNLTTGVLLLGGTGGASTTSLYGPLSVPTINGSTAGNAMTIGGNITSGSVSVGNAGGNNTVNIGSVGGAGPTGTINIGTSASTVNVGGVGATAFIGGTVVIGATGSGNVTVGQTGTGTTTLNSPTTNITGGGPTGSINIGLNLTNSNSALVLGNTSMGPIYIGQSATRGGNINIGTGGTGNVYLGNSTAPLVLSGSTTTFSSPLTLGSAPASVNYNVAAPYIGTVITGALSGNFSSGTSAATLNIVTTGTYLFTFSIIINNNITGGSGWLVGTNSPCGIQNLFYPTGLNGTSFAITGSAVVPQATGNYYFNISTTQGGTLSGSGSSYSFFYAVRIG